MIETEEEALAIPHNLRNLGRALSLLRDLRKLAVRETARKAGVGVSQLSKYENGHSLPGLPSLGKILAVLEISFLDFFNVVALFDLFEEEMRSGTLREGMVFNLLHMRQPSRGLISDSLSLATRRVVDDLILLHGEIMTEAVRPGIEERGKK